MSFVRNLLQRGARSAKRDHVNGTPEAMSSSADEATTKLAGLSLEGADTEVATFALS